MHIRKSGDNYVLHRYGGSHEGKTLTSRIGAIPVGTSPGAIPDELLQDLTPKELLQLKVELEKEEAILLTSKANKLIGDMANMASSLDASLMTLEIAENVQRAADKLSRLARRVLVKARATKKPEVV